MKIFLKVALLGLLLTASHAGLTKLSLQDLAKVDVDKLTCDSPEFPKVRNSLLQWREALEMH